MDTKRRISVIIPARNEEATIASVVRDFRSAAGVHEVVVVDNNCTDRTAERARAEGARVVEERRPGYGSALRAGMAAAAGDVFVLVEADGSFRAADLPKLLVYVDDAQLVLGTRTTRQLVEQGANMDFLLRWGNVIAAKILELLWYVPHEARLTDVGCTFRAIDRTSWERVRGGLRETGPAFSPEMICEALRQSLRVVEIPVNYYRRLGGESKHSRGLFRILRTALSMYRCILRKRFEPRSRRRDRPAAPETGPSAGAGPA